MAIKHIVMWQFKEQAEGQSKAQNVLQAQQLLEACRELVPGILAFEVALATPDLESTCDLLLYSVFADKAALDAYQNHPQHVALKPFLKAVNQTRHCFDYAVT